IQLLHTMNRYSLQIMNLHNLSSSSQTLHLPNSKYSSFVFWDSMETMDAAVLQKWTTGLFSKGHPCKKIADVSIHKYLYPRNRQDSMDRSFFPVHILSSRCLLHQCNQNLSIQNRQCPRDDQLHSSNN